MVIDMVDEDWKFHRLMKRMCDVYDPNRSDPPIRELDRFMIKVFDIYEELNKH